jgi:hypothetical protein
MPLNSRKIPFKVTTRNRCFKLIQYFYEKILKSIKVQVAGIRSRYNETNQAFSSLIQNSSISISSKKALGCKNSPNSHTNL